MAKTWNWRRRCGEPSRQRRRFRRRRAGRDGIAEVGEPGFAYGEIIERAESDPGFCSSSLSLAPGPRDSRIIGTASTAPTAPFSKQRELEEEGAAGVRQGLRFRNCRGRLRWFRLRLAGRLIDVGHRFSLAGMLADCCAAGARCALSHATMSVISCGVSVRLRCTCANPAYSRRGGQRRRDCAGSDR